MLFFTEKKVDWPLLITAREPCPHCATQPRKNLAYAAASCAILLRYRCHRFVNFCFDVLQSLRSYSWVNNSWYSHVPLYVTFHFGPHSHSHSQPESAHCRAKASAWARRLVLLLLSRLQIERGSLAQNLRMSSSHCTLGLPLFFLPHIFYI